MRLVGGRPSVARPVVAVALVVATAGCWFPAVVATAALLVSPLDHSGDHVLLSPSSSSTFHDAADDASATTTTRRFLESNVPTSSSSAAGVNLVSFDSPPPTPSTIFSSMGTASPTVTPLPTTTTTTLMNTPTPTTAQRTPADSLLLPAYVIAIDTNLATNENVYTSYCPEGKSNATTDAMSNDPGSRNTTEPPVSTVTIFTQLIAFDYQFKTTKSRSNQSSDDNVTAVSHDVVVWTVELGLHEYLSRLYLGNCQTQTQPFVVSVLDSSPLDTPSNVSSSSTSNNSTGCAVEDESCHVVNGYITVSVYYPRIVAPNDTTIVETNATQTRRRLDNTTENKAAFVLTDQVVAESFAGDLESFFRNKTIDTSNGDDGFTSVARLEFIAITNFVPDQATFDGTGPTPNDPATTAAGIRGTTTTASPSGSINYSWGAAILGVALSGLIVTAIMAVRFLRRHGKAPVESADLETLPASPDEKGDLAIGSSSRGGARGKDSPRSTKRSQRRDKTASSTNPMNAEGSTFVDRADGNSSTVTASNNSLPNHSFDYTKKHAFVLGDESWDDNDYDTLSDHEASIEVLYRQEAKKLSLSPYRWHHSTRNSNPPSFLSSLEEESPATPPKSKMSTSRRHMDYDPYGSNDRSVPDTQDL